MRLIRLRLLYPLVMAWAALWVLSACSPALNWRSVHVPDTSLSIMLPCKPDHAARDVDWDMGKARLHMLGCKADGSLYTIAHLSVAQAADAPLVLERWRQSLQAQWQLPNDAPGGPAFAIPGALELPQARHMQWQGRDARGAAAFADVRWFVQLEGQGARLYQAMVLSTGRPVATAALETFVQGLQLQR